MAVVPQAQRQVQQRAAPDVSLGARVSETAVGGGVAQGINQAAAVVTQVQDEERQKADQVAVLEAEKSLAEWQNHVLHNQDNGYLTTKGKSAAENAQNALKSYDDYTDEIAGTLANENQKLAFKRLATGRRAGYDSSIQQHVARESYNYDVETTNASLEVSRNDAAMNYRDPAKVAEAVDAQEAKIEDFARRNNKSREWVQGQKDKHLSLTHYSVVDAMLTDNQDKAARAYYSANKDDIRDADTRAKLEKMLEEGTLRGESQRKAREILDANEDRAAAMNQVDKITDPKLQDEVRRRVKDGFGERAAADAERKRVAFKKASDILEEAKTLDKIPPGVLADMSSEQRRALEVRYRQIAYGIEPANNDKLWVGFQAMPTAKLAALTEEDMLTKYRPYLDNAHWEKALAQWKDIKDGKGAAKDRHAATITFKDVVLNELKTSGIIDPNKREAKYTDTEAKRYAQFESAAANAVEDFERSHLQGKRKATQSEMQDVVRKLMAKKMFVEKWGTDPQLPVDMILADERGDVYVPFKDVPDDDRKRIENYMQKNRIVPTRDRVQKAYAQYLLGDRVAFEKALTE